MHRNGEPRRYCYLAASVPGVAGLFLPYAYNVSPVEAILGFLNDYTWVSIHIMPTLMALMILAWQLLRIRSVRIPAPVMLALTRFAVAVAILPHIAILISFWFEGIDFTPTAYIAILVISPLPTLFSIWIFTAILRKGAADTSRTDILLYCSPLPSYGYWLTASLAEDFPDGWQSGTYAIFLAACCYLAMIASSWRSMSALRLAGTRTSFVES